MAVIINAPSQEYAPQAHTIPFTVNSAHTRIEATLTHPNTEIAWPTGPLLEYEVLWGGVSTGASSIGGGVRNDKAGVPIVGDVVTGFATTKQVGVTSGAVRVTVLQTLTTAIRVESF